MRILSGPMRKGFTLVEVLVAAALSLGIMVVLTGLFQTGMESFRKLKAIGDMQERLRAAASILKVDLATPHFGGPFKPRVQGPYLKDQFLDQADWEPPQQGFFRIVQGSSIQTLPPPTPPTPPNFRSTAGYYLEGLDAEGLPVLVATDHALHFTINVLGAKSIRNDVFYSDLLSTRLVGPDPITLNTFLAKSEPNAFIDKAIGGEGTLTSTWAEVAYYLRRTSTIDNPDGAPLNGGQIALFALCRRQRLILSQGADTAVPPDYQEVSSAAIIGNRSNTPSSITHPDRRWQGLTVGSSTVPYSTPAAQLSGRYTGDDVIMTDVISFEVRPTWIAVDPGQYPWAVGTRHSKNPGDAGGFTDLPFDDLPSPSLPLSNPSFGTARVFDTWTNQNDPNPPLNNKDYATHWNPAPSPMMMPVSQPNLQVPLRVRINALQIRIRVWDSKLNSARQVTIVQDA